MKRLFSLLLTACLLLGLAVPAFADEAQTACPMIYLEGQGIGLYRDDGTQVYNLGIDLMSRLQPNLTELVKRSFHGDYTGDYGPFSELLYETVVPVYETEALGKDGTPTDGSHVYPGNMWRGQGSLSNIKETIPLASGERYPVYRWHFDWRLSPITLADELRDLIDAVLEETGAEKVDLISRCLSTNIVYAYLYTYGGDKIHSSTFYSSSTYGIGAANALFSGELTVDPNALERFLSYYRDSNNLVIRDEQTTDLIFVLLALANEMKLVGVGLDRFMRTYNAFKKEAMVPILRATFATFPSYWAMVSPAYYETARAYVFQGVEDEYAGLLEKTDAYYEMQKQMNEKLLALKDDVRFAVIAKYGYPAFPLSDDANEESDGYVSVGYASYGAKAADYNKTLSDSYIRKAVQSGHARYLSADCKIDAATALFPDTTWFTKDLYHTHFPDCVNDLCVAFANNDNMTVFTDPAYPQFLQYTPTNSAGSDYATGTLTPIRSIDDTEDNTAGTKRTFWTVLRDFFRALGTFLKTLFQR